MTGASIEATLELWASSLRDVKARGMTRDETVALFLECEARRDAARAAGKPKYEAHLAAKAHWNAWVDRLRAERKAMKADGRWDSEQNDCYSSAKAMKKKYQKPKLL